jgi:hypothetical protein
MEGGAVLANTDRAITLIRSRRCATAVALAVVLGGVVLSGCTLVRAVKKVAQTVEHNKTTMDAFTNKIQSGEAAPFEATYMTTGASPATIVYAVKPPNGLLFKDTPSGAGNTSSFDIIVNPAGEYSCTPPSSSSSSWSCEKLETADAATENKIFDFYTPSHWVTFLNDFSLAAGFAGDKVTSSTMSVNGFNMQCVDFVASGVAGTSTICTTAQGILGYVKVASDATSFQIESYSSSPASSLFELPQGATITTPSTSTTS